MFLLDCSGRHNVDCYVLRGLGMLPKEMVWMNYAYVQEIKMSYLESWLVMVRRIEQLFPPSQIYITKAPFLIGLEDRLKNPFFTN